MASLWGHRFGGRGCVSATWHSSAAPDGTSADSSRANSQASRVQPRVVDSSFSAEETRAGRANAASSSSDAMPRDESGKLDTSSRRRNEWSRLPPPINPPDRVNPSPATLKEQWSYVIRMYSRMYSHAWGTAILAGLVMYGIGCWVKGDPLASRGSTANAIDKEREKEKGEE